MKILCSLSGLEFNCEFFPGTFHSRETYHPIFNIPQKRLLSYMGKWGAGELTPTDSYLLFLSVLHSSDLVDFRVPVFRTPQTDSIIAQNMEGLFKTVIKLNSVTNPSVIFPHYAITSETRYLTNVRYWIENWRDSYQDYLSGAEKYSAHESAKLIQRERALERLIKNPHKKISEYASQLAEWAAAAGNFPEFLTKSPWSNDDIPCREYWKQIIVRCSKVEFLYSIPKADLQELLEHCEEQIAVTSSSIFSHHLFRVLRIAMEKQKNFLGLGDIDAKSGFSILETTDTVESANFKAMIDSAPEEEPRIEQYPTRFTYMKAKVRWEMAERAKKERRVSEDRRAGTGEQS